MSTDHGRGGGARSNALPLTSSEDLDALRPEWARLHADARSATVFNHPDWAAAWLRHFGDGPMPIFLAVRQDEDLVGAIALNMDPAATGLLGDPNVSDFGPIIAAPGAEHLVARGLLEWLNEDMAPNATVWGLPETSPLPDAIAGIAPDFGWACSVEDEAVTPVTALPASFDDFLAGLSKKDRHELRRKLRQAEAAGTLAFEEHTDPGEITQRFDRFLEFMRASRPGKAEFLDGPAEAFYRDVAAFTSALGLARLATLSIDGEPAAMTWCFENAEESLLYNSGYDPRFAGVSVGIVSKAYALRSAIDRGKRRFNFLRGDEDYKFQMGGKAQRVLRLVLRHR